MRTHDKRQNRTSRMPALTAGTLLFVSALVSVPATAQQPQVIPAPEIGGDAPVMDAYLWHVRGLPPGQRLAVYSGAGPKFRIIYALDEGTPIERLSCKDSRGGYWCRIATVDRPRISGWVDGRFLLEETGFAPPQEERDLPLEPEIIIDPFGKPHRP